MLIALNMNSARCFLLLLKIQFKRISMQICMGQCFRFRLLSAPFTCNSSDNIKYLAKIGFCFVFFFVSQIAAILLHSLTSNSVQIAMRKFCYFRRICIIYIDLCLSFKFAFDWQKNKAKMWNKKKKSPTYYRVRRAHAHTKTRAGGKTGQVCIFINHSTKIHVQFRHFFARFHDYNEIWLIKKKEEALKKCTQSHANSLFGTFVD